jgi:hypothetical protein
MYYTSILFAVHPSKVIIIFVILLKMKVGQYYPGILLIFQLNELSFLNDDVIEN